MTPFSLLFIPSSLQSLPCHITLSNFMNSCYLIIIYTMYAYLHLCIYMHICKFIFVHLYYVYMYIEVYKYNLLSLLIVASMCISGMITWYLITNWGLSPRNTNSPSFSLHLMLLSLLGGDRLNLAFGNFFPLTIIPFP